MKIAESQPDVVVLQELKAPQDKFPEAAIRDLGYDAIWHGQKSWNGVAMLSRVGEIQETRRGLPDDPDPSQSRYIEAAVNGILIGGLYLPNGNPRPGPKFDYKLRWFEKLIEHAANLLESGLPVMLAGDFNVMPTERDVYKPERWVDDALFAPEVRDAFFRLTGQGWTDALRTRRSTRSSTTSGTHTAGTPDLGSITCCSVQPWPIASSTHRLIATCAGGRRPVTMHRFGSNLPTLRRSA
jgi:exodeoxyribonuclease-3